MFKKFLCSFLSLVFVISSVIVAAPVMADSKVCGIDGKTYDSEAAAETAGVDVSYEFACTKVTDESKLFEKKSDIHLAGMLIEIGSTDVPTNIIVRDNASKKDFTINVTKDTILGQKKDQGTSLSDWIPGDQIRVIGKKNENTDYIEATTLVNLSIAINDHQAVNGWITKISSSTKEISYKWGDKENVFKYDDNTRFVVGLKNPATANDLKVGDRIRARLIFRQGETPLARIVITLRRGNDLFMKIRTFITEATLVRLDSTIIPTTIQVKVDKTPGLKADDVNNLIGAEGTLVTVNITEDTKIVRKYFGKTNLSELSAGDKLQIVGRVNDDGTLDAKVIKDNSIWQTSTQGYAGVVNEVSATSSYIIVNWAPYKHITKKKLKEKLKEEKNKVTAQSSATDCIGDSSGNTDCVGVKEIRKGRVNKIIERVKILKERVVKEKENLEKVGKSIREVMHKKIKIERIKHEGIKIGDLIEKLPSKKIKVEIASTTKIVIGTNNKGTISDIKNGDKVRIRGIMNENTGVVTAETIVVVNSLPEIEDSEDTSIDDVNEVVSIIKLNDSNNIASSTVSKTEEEVEDDD